MTLRHSVSRARSSRTHRWRPAPFESCSPATTPDPGRASTAAIRHWPPSTRRPRDQPIRPIPPPPVADPHRRHQRPGVRQLTTLTSAVLDPLMAADPAGPRITYYDDATGERIELSTVTLANWAAKTGNLLRDELGAGPGQSRRGAAARALADRRVLFGIWWIGAEVVLTGRRHRAVHRRPAARRRRCRRCG